MNATTVPTAAGKPKLLDRLRHAVPVRHMAPSTEKAYVYWCRRYILYHNKRHPVDMGHARKPNVLAGGLASRMLARPRPRERP